MRIYVHIKPHIGDYAEPEWVQGVYPSTRCGEGINQVISGVGMIGESYRNNQPSGQRLCVYSTAGVGAPL